ncbi:MAG TPA: carboxypeptidase regulatory-like domain-containing protein [Vicinamibacteria bacterium]|nr:carboxypeptidase regulatory-like domain-containing protein [Vicinamibacteria bacterium]
MRQLFLLGGAAILVLTTVVAASAQTGDGSLRGYVRDESGAILPGVTATATSDVIMAPRTAITDGTGLYRIPNLPPGEYVLSFELSGFTTYRQEGIVLRAGANYNVDAVLAVGGVEETVTVTAETPMLEIARPSNVLNIEGEFQREMPIQARNNWSDFLELTPGVNARPFDDGSGRMVYFGHATEHFAHVIQLEGMQASSYNDSQVTYIGMDTEMIEDVQVKTGGVDAASPLGTGLVINVVTKSGGNSLSGSGAFSYQPDSWNGDNAPTGEGFAGTPSINVVKQFDASVGGPIVQDKAWFFGSFRTSRIESGISRTDREVNNLNTLSGLRLFDLSGQDYGTVPQFSPFNQQVENFQPYLKVTGQFSPNHEASVYYQRDFQTNGSNREFLWEPIWFVETGGDLVGGKVTSVWGTDTTSQFTFNWNNKTVNTDFTKTPTDAPYIEVHEGYTESGGQLTGTGRIIAGNADDITATAPARVLLFRFDLTRFAEGFGGSHELQTGLFLAPSNIRDNFTQYSNANGDGYYLYDFRLLSGDENDPSQGAVPFHRVRRSVSEVQTTGARDRDIGLYLQDNWKPSPRLTLNLGLRVDFVRRFDQLRDFARMNSTVFGPRVGFSYLLTEDARNVVRGFAGRVHEAVMGRDQVTSYTGSEGGSGGLSDLINEYDREGDGIFEQVVVSPRSAGVVDPRVEWDENLTQPFVDEYILGFRKQFPKQFSLDVATIHRRYTKNYALLEVNGIYPDAPGLPFIGFGAVDPNRGTIFQQTNNTWSKLVYTALEITGTQRLGRKVQAMFGYNYQWQHFAGDFNPHDPAKFISPEKFDSNRALFMPRGNNENNSLTNSTNLSYNPTWRRYSLRAGINYRGPYGINIGGSYTANAGPWSGALIDDPGRDPVYGPARVPLANGTTFANPLATAFRLVGENRGTGCELTTLPNNGVSCDGQARAPTIHTVSVKFAKIFNVGGTREFELGGNIFNMFNAGHHHQFTYSGANRTYSANYAELRSLQAPVGFQLSLGFRF